MSLFLGPKESRKAMRLSTAIYRRRNYDGCVSALTGFPHKEASQHAIFSTISL